MAMFLGRIQDRMTVIREYVTSGEVLDLGCVDARTGRESSGARIERKPHALFREIVKLNPQTLGVDIDEEGVRVLQQQGFQVVCADVETMDLGRRFDTIVAGEIVEHLENPGTFLRNLHRHLRPAGTLILSTPNPFYTAQVAKIWRYGRPQVHEDHMGWQDPLTLGQLLRRTGFAAVGGSWIQPQGKRWKTWSQLLRPYFAHSFLMVAKPQVVVNTKAA
jgi:SAM-dependent methyltransferase